MKPEHLDRKFEGAAKLQKLLAQAGVLADVDDITEAFKAAQKDDVPAATVISALFEDEPRFASPKDARALYGNLFGLWDLVARGATPKTAPSRPARPVPPPAPPFFPKEGPDEAWVERAWRYLELAPPKALQKLQHAYDHRCDALLTWLDEQGPSEVAFAFAQHLLFELFAMIELGSPNGIGIVDPPVNQDEVGGGVPSALAAYAEEALFESELEETDGLNPLMGRALAALWKARKD
jgi:hypothetical protein